MRTSPRSLGSVLTVAATVVLLGLALAPPQALHRLQETSLDLFYHGSPATAPGVVVVGLDRETFARTGRDFARFFPCYPTIIRRLTQAGARAIAFDISVATAPSTTAAAAFIDAVEAGPPFVVASQLPADDETVPDRPVGGTERTVLASAAIRRGFVDFVRPGVDGDAIRRVALTVERRDGSFASFALVVWASATGQTLEGLRTDSELLTVGTLSVPLENGAFRIPYVAPSGTVPYVSCADVLTGDPSMLHAVFHDRVVIVGPQEAWFQDVHATPVGRILGAQIHANIVQALLDGRSLTGVSPPTTGFAIVLAAAFGFIAARRLRRTWSFTVVVAGAGALVWCSARLVLESIWFPPFVPLVALLTGFLLPLAVSTIHEALEGLTVKRLFGQFVSREVFEAIMRSRDGLNLTGTSLEATILFADIRGFTTLSEELGPEQTFAVLNDYFHEMVEVIFRNGGRLDKYIGDAIMAVFGAPFSAPDDALRAVRSAHEMQQRLRGLNKSFQERGRPPLTIGIGLCTGPIHAGVIGTSEKMEYAVIGDTVNTASRLEHLTKEARCPILMSESTYEAVKDHVEAADLGERDIRGRQEKLRVYGLMAMRDD